MTHAKRALVLRATGTNCDVETGHALSSGGWEVLDLHINRLKASPERLRDVDALVIPGGFSYGDDIGSGVVFAHIIKQFLRPELERFLERGGRVLGICNGFQALLRAGLLTASEGHFEDRPSATLAWNSSGRYEDRWVHLALSGSRTPWIPEDVQIACPVRHAEGRFVAADGGVLDRLEAAGRVVARYVNADGSRATTFPANPNGSQNAIAGICSASGLVLGMMPHPECALRAEHFPGWTREAPEHFPAAALFAWRDGVTSGA